MTSPADGNLTVSRALDLAHDRESRVDLRILLAHVLRRPIAWLLTHPEALLDDASCARFEHLRQRRQQGEPVAYLTGEREFHGLPFLVSPHVLIPRPETELLVDCVLEEFPLGRAGRVLDLGTGSGAIAVTLACRRPHLHISASDCDAAALAVAQQNALRLAPAVQIDFRLGDWLSPLQGERFDAIVSNPPYIRDGDPHLHSAELRFEPSGALVGGANGLRDLASIIEQAPEHLVAGGYLALEHGYDQSEAVQALMRLAGFVSIRSHSDLAGIPRVTEGRRCIDQPNTPDYAQGLS